MSHNSLLESTVNLYATAKKVEEIDRSAYVCGFLTLLFVARIQAILFPFRVLDSQNG